MSILWSRDVTAARTRIRLTFLNRTAKETLYYLAKRCGNTLLLIECRSSPVNIEGKAIKTSNSSFFCASIRCCEIFQRSSSRVLQGNGGSCSARSPSCFSLCRARGTSIPSDYSNRIDRNMPLQKRPISRCLSPFGDGQAAAPQSDASLRASKQMTSPRVYIRLVTWSWRGPRWGNADCRHIWLIIFYKCSLVKVI